MQLHLVGGFLGSGKTTAIIGAAQRLIAQGARVGIVTNDQGKHLVDTAFFQEAQLPTVEVSGGCFCCNYDDFEARLKELEDTALPDVVFAESVGSCADIVATVIKPFLAFRGPDRQPASFSVFTDVRLLRRHLAGLPLPFSENVVYIFEQQMEEAGLLVLNKTDLLPAGEIEQLESLAAARFPGKAMHRQTVSDAASIGRWLARISGDGARLALRTLDIDYERYGAGEADLAWLDEELTLRFPAGTGKAALEKLLDCFFGGIQSRNWAIGHVKLFAAGAKISVVSPDMNSWRTQIPQIDGHSVRILVNARVQAPADELKALLEGCAAGAETGAAASFHPAFPRPTHRMK